MAMELKIPSLGESVSEGTIARWVKADGDIVGPDDIVLELETDKAMMEIPAGEAGRLEILVQAGETVTVDQVVGRIHEAEGAAAAAKPAAKPAAAAASSAPAAADKAAPAPSADKPAAPASGKAADKLSPAVQRVVAETGVDPAAVAGSGKDGRLLKADVEAAAASGGSGKAAAAAPAAPAVKAPAATAASTGGETRVPMTRIRKRIAERLVESQRTAAILTTFNDLDMSAVIELRKRHKEAFEKKHGVRLGFMSLFSRACVMALQELREINAFIEGDEIVYHDYVNLGIAVGTDRGLMVPVIRNAETLGLAGLEKAIGAIAAKARDNKITPDDLAGGTFSISNGGVYGSLMSTPILNPPQSGILGMHRTEDRPVVVNGEIVIRPMMYLALSYDHRIVDGEQAVTFLVRVKQYLEDPARMLLEL
jgi:2-oxoglutarate dehydrogenase E2 component (dihydrolipoamide succinyltransferase)